MANSPIEAGETKTFKKQILRFGKWLHPAAPNGMLEITKDYVKQLMDNFKASPYAPITRGHQDQADLEVNPSLIVTKNIKALEADDNGLNAVFDLDSSELDKYNDVSVSIDPFYTDHESGVKRGAMLKHIALVTNPYIKGLNPFTELEENNQGYLINLSEIEVMKTEIKAQEAEVVETEKIETESAPEVVETEVAKDESIAEVEKTEEVIEEVAKEEVKAEDEAPKQAEEEPKTEEVVTNASEALQARILELEEQLNVKNKEIALKEAEANYNELLKVGKIVPALKEPFMQLAEAGNSEINLSDGTKTSVKEAIKNLFDKMPVMVDFAEHGQLVETGENMSMSGLKSEMRARKKNMTDSAFEQWWTENQDKIEMSAKKYMK